MSLSVGILAMSDAKNSHHRLNIVNLVKDSVDPRPDSPRSEWVVQFLAARQARIFRKGQHPLFNLFVKRGRNRVVVFLGQRQDQYSVPHLRFRRFSSRACSKGMGVSPEALASSHARMSSRSSSSSRIFSYSSMLMTTATRSPRSFTTNWRSLPIGDSLRAVYSRRERRTIETVSNGSKKQKRTTKNLEPTTENG